MLGFYVCLDDWHPAAGSIPMPRPTCCDLVVSIWTLLNLYQLQEAKPVQRKCLRLLPLCKREFDMSTLAEALRRGGRCRLCDCLHTIRADAPGSPTPDFPQGTNCAEMAAAWLPVNNGC